MYRIVLCQVVPQGSEEFPDNYHNVVTVQDQLSLQQVNAYLPAYLKYNGRSGVAISDLDGWDSWEDRNADDDEWQYERLDGNVIHVFTEPERYDD